MSDPVQADIFGNISTLHDATIATSLSTHNKEDRASMDHNTIKYIKDDTTKTL